MDSHLRRAVLQALGDGPLDKAALSRKLRIPPAKRSTLRSELAEMEREGLVTSIRNGRYCLPQEADLVTGVVHFHPNGTAKLIPATPGAPALLISADKTGLAMHGDRAVARLSGRPSTAEPRHEGQIIRVMERARETVVGTLQKSQRFFYVVADDPRFVHHIYVPEPRSPLAANPGDKVVARLLPWTSRNLSPEGELIEVLGSAGTPGIDILSIIRKHNLPTEFPEDVVREAEAISPIVPAHEIGRREDLRKRFVFTIDPDDARDFDDAIDIEETPSGWRLGVHIADVSHYVQPRSRLNREAFSRGNSVYLVDRVIPMLPEALSNGICSLRPDEDRLTFSAFMEINRRGKVTHARFAKSIIRSAKRLTYKEAFAILQKPPEKGLSQTLHKAWKLGSLIRKRRFENGSLDMDFPEIKVWLDENGRPDRLERVENDISHQLIEEFMLLANETVARALKLARQPTVYRIHEKPDIERLNEFRDLAATYGFPTGDLNQRPELQRLLASIRGSREEYAVKLGLLKSLKRARYHPNALGHYGLNKPDYTHFTSPIRRYADLLVHRSLERQLGLSKQGPTGSELDSASEHVSTTERIAAEAERESVRIKKLEYFQAQITDRKGGVFHAVITDVRNFGFFVELPEFLLTGLVHVSSLDDDFYRHDAARARFVGRRTHKSYRAGDAMEVVVSRVDPFKQQVDFRPARRVG